ncbi:MAG: amino acid ABC transporter ATP-binding protein [Fusobacteriaceae bacterium]
MEIKVENLIKQYGNNKVLQNLNLTLEKVNTLAIIGPSGGGKSTFLRVLAGLEVAQMGKIEINGKEIPKEEAELLNYRKNVGVVFQSYNLFPHLSAINNILLPLEKVHKIPKAIAEKKAIELLKRYKLEEHMDKKPHELSGGQQQRVAIVRALALDVDFFLLDEPTSALDPALTMETLEGIMELKKLKKDLILVTHEMGFARHVAEHIIFIDEGRVIEEGASKEIFENPKTEKLKSFLGKALHY